MRLKLLVGFLSLSVLASNAAAQDTSARDERPATLTLTKGLYPEIFENDTLRKVGRVWFNTATEEIVRVEMLGAITCRVIFHALQDVSEGHIPLEPTLHPMATTDHSRTGRWLSLDPMQGVYPGLSPYSFAGNSPIMFCDGDGRLVVLAPGLSDDEKTRVETAIKRVQERQPELYAYLNTLKYHPGLNGGAGGYLTPGQEGYSDAEAYDIVVQVGVADVDGIPRSTELRQRSEANFSETFDFSGAQVDLMGTTEWSNMGMSIGLDDKGNPLVWAVGSGDEGPYEATITSPEEAAAIVPAYDILQPKSSTGPHFTINLDDFTGSKDWDGEIMSHEFGHVEGDLLYQGSAVYFHTGKRMTQGGHEPGNLGGENAEKRQKEYAKK